MPHPQNGNGGIPLTGERLERSRLALRPVRTVESGRGFREGLLTGARLPLRLLPVETGLDITAFFRAAEMEQAAQRRTLARAVERLKAQHRLFLRGRGPSIF